MTEDNEVASGRAAGGRLVRFLFEDLPIRGGIVRLDATWRSLLVERPYPAPVQELLGQALAVAPLLASTLKFEGRVSLQLEGTGAVDMLVVQVTHDLKIRGMARHGGVTVPCSFPELVGQSGRLALTLEPARAGRRYQAWVALQEEGLRRAWRDISDNPNSCRRGFGWRPIVTRRWD